VYSLFHCDAFVRQTIQPRRDSRNQQSNPNRDGPDPTDRQHRVFCGNPADPGASGNAHLDKEHIKAEQYAGSFRSHRDQVEILNRAKRSCANRPEHEQRYGDENRPGNDGHQSKGKDLDEHSAEECTAGACPISKETAKFGANQTTDSQGEENNAHFPFGHRRDGEQEGSHKGIDYRESDEYKKRDG
jgi:hypothetical protein